MKNLHELIKTANQLRIKMEAEPSALLSQDFKQLFEQLTQIITPEEMEIALDIYDNYSLLLEQKLHLIKDFIVRLINRDNLRHFLMNSSEDRTICQIFNPSFHMPVLFPSISHDYLLASFSKLTQNALKTRTLNIIPKSTPVIEAKTIEIIDVTNALFQDKMMDFLTQIDPILPATMEQILSTNTSSQSYFEEFTLLLHLLQEGYLTYLPETSQFKKGEQTDE